MSETWRTIGGTQNYQQLNSINTNNLYTNTLTVREAYLGLFTINGFLKVTDDVTFSKSLYIDKFLFVYGNTFLSDHLYLGSNYINYLYGTDTGIGINTETPNTLFDIYGNTITVFHASTSQTEIENYPGFTSEYNGISVGADSLSSYIHFYNSNNATIGDADTTMISTYGNLYIEPDKSTIIKSRLIVSNKAENPQHLSTENFTIYDTPNTLFRYDLYGNIFGKAGTSLTNVAGGERTTTFITLNSYTKQGFGIGGGVITDSDMSIGTFGTYNINGTYTVAQTTMSSGAASIGNQIIKKVAVGFNNISPQYGSYILDINGPVQVRFSEINNQALTDFEFKNISYCDSNSYYGIAVGSPIEVDPSFQQYVLYTQDGGISWSKSRVKSSDSDDLEDSINYFYASAIQSGDFAVIAGNNNYMYYSTDNLESWTKYTYLYDYLDFVQEDYLQTILTNSLYAKDNVVFGTYKNQTSGYTSDRGFFAYIPDPSGGTAIDYGYSIRYKINTLDNSDLIFVSCTGYGDYLYFLATSDLSGSYLIMAEFDYDSMNFIQYFSGVEAYSYTNFSGATLYDHYIGEYGEYLVGDHIYYKDASEKWVESTYVPEDNDFYLNKIEVLDSDNAVAVGSQGMIIYTKNGGISWTKLDSSILNAYGNADVLINSSLNLLHIHSIDSSTFLISYAGISFVYSTQAGESRIYHVHIPTIYNRSDTYLMDICGSVHISGDLHVEEGGDTYLDGDLLVRGAETVNDSLSVTGDKTNKNYMVTIGSINSPTTQVSQGTLAIQGQNGMNGYNTWKFQVGSINSGQSSYDTTRLRIIDETNSAQERLTIDTYGYIGIGTTAPTSLLDISGVTTISYTEDATGFGTGAFRVLGGASISKSLYVNGQISMVEGVDSTSTTTGAVVVDGGIGVLKNAYIGGNLVLTNNVAAVSSSTGTLIIQNGGGIGVDGSIYIGGNLTLEDDMPATSQYSGALNVPYGGIACGGSLFTGGNITICDTTAAVSPIYAAALNIPYGGAAIAGSLFMGGNITICNTTAAVSSGTGGLIVFGGAGIEGDLYVGQTINATDEIRSSTGFYVGGDSTNTDYYVLAGSINDPTTQISQGTLAVQGQNGMNNYSTWKIQVGTLTSTTSSYDTTRLRIVDETNDGAERLTIDMNGYIGIGTTTPETTLDVSGFVTIRGGSGGLATSPQTGALLVSSEGMGVAGSIFTGGNITIQDTTATVSPGIGALIVATGGVGVGGSIFVGGNITICDTTAAALHIPEGSATIGGSIFTSGNITIYDTTEAVSPDTGSLIVGGGIGLAGSLYTAGNITIEDTTIPTSCSSPAALCVPYGGVVFGGPLYTAGNITICDTTAATSTTTGALVVEGGVGITGDLYVGGYINMTDIEATSLSVTGSTSGSDYTGTIGSISSPSTIITQGTLALQGQNGMNNYSTWKLQVGTITTGTSSYDTTRLRIVDETNDGAERMTIDMYGYVGIGTTTPASALDVSGAVTIRGDGGDSVTSPQTGALLVSSEGMGVAGSIFTGGNITIQDTTAAVSPGTGALIVEAGGIGVAGSVFTGGNITIYDTTSAALNIPTGSATIGGSIFVGGNITIYDTTAAISPGTGALVVSGGGIGVAGSVFTGGNITIYDTTSPTLDATTAALNVPYGGIYCGGAFLTGGNITISDTTAAVSTETGALIVAGGVGITGDLYVGGYINMSEIETTSISITGSTSGTDYNATIGSISSPTTIVTQGTLALQGQNGLNNYSTWKLQVGATNTGTSSYDTTRIRIVDETNDGAERMTIDMYGYVGIGTTTPETQLDVSGAVTIRGAGSDAVTSPQTGALLVSSEGMGVAGSIFTGGNITIQDTTAAVSPGTGALIVANGGVGVGGSIFVGGNITIYDTTDAALNIPAGSATIGGSIFTGGNITIYDTTAAVSQGTGALIVSEGGVGVGGSIFTGGNITIYDTTSSTSSTGAAALSVPYGGIACGGAIFTGGNITISDTTASVSSVTGALIVAGGVGINGDLNVGGYINMSELETTSLSITGTTSGTNYSATIGSLSSPSTMISEGTLTLQGQNGLDNYTSWSISVGTIESGTSSYDTTRLRITDNIEAEERLTIDMYGYIGIGTTTPQASLDINGSLLAEQDTTFYGNIITKTGTYISNTTLGYIANLTSDAQTQITNISYDVSAISYISSTNTTQITGNLAATGIISAPNFYTTSDYRVKENIQTLSADINTKNLRPVSYFNKIINKDDIGLIAHEVGDIYPFMITGEKDGADYQSINYRHIIMALINDIKELRAEIDEIKKNIV